MCWDRWQNERGPSVYERVRKRVCVSLSLSWRASVAGIGCSHHEMVDVLYILFCFLVHVVFLFRFWYLVSRVLLFGSGIWGLGWLAWFVPDARGQPGL
jgi:hypothetical protein